MSEGQTYQIPRRPVASRVPSRPDLVGQNLSNTPSVGTPSSLTEVDRAAEDTINIRDARTEDKNGKNTRVEPLSRQESTIPPSQRKRTFSGLSLWAIEGVALLFAFGMLAAIFATLATYQNKRYPNWAYDINLNFLVAIYTIVLRALLLVPLAQIISQGKWTWFSDARPIRDLEVFDSASRSAWGSIRLLFLTWRPNKATLSAIVILMTFAIGPLAQQAVRTELCQIPITVDAEIPIAPSLVSDIILPSFKRTSPAYILRNSISRFAPLRGLLTVDGDQVPSPFFSCATSNCTFPEVTDGITYSSVGYCSECFDQTHLIRDQGAGKFGGINYTVPEWTFADGTVFNMLLAGPTFDQLEVIRVLVSDSSSTLDPWDRVRMMFVSANGCEEGTDPDTGKKTRTCSQDNLADGVAPLPGFNLFAMECAMKMCVRNYNGSVTNNILTEETVSSLDMHSIGRRGFFGKDPTADNQSILEASATPNNYTAVRFPCYANDGVKYTAENISEYAGAITGDYCWDEEGNLYDTDTLTETFTKEFNETIEFPYCISGADYYKTEGAPSIGSADVILFNNTEQGGTWALAPPECSFWAPETLQNMIVTIRQEFDGQCTASVLLDNYFMPPWDDNNCVDQAIANVSTSYDLNRHWIALTWDGGNATLQSVARLWENMAVAGTNALRDNGMQISSSLQQRAYADGTALETTLCVRFDPRWLILASVMVAFTTALLLWAMFETVMVLRQRQKFHVADKPPTWKSSLLPLLFHGLANPNDESSGTASATTASIDDTGRPMEIGELKDKTKDMVVRWRKDCDSEGPGFGLVQRPREK
ncbi:uncharacterized protein MKZ38_003382 [Zalerion maritima]|uniref:Uncharacterized protein n=1 Tax=Zalerion maritima TaxID=339359 RepID=A0AAD5WRT2_9PEZI|nr:uncharacterized protein MKZ38_003382 [Zalerion maritima]